MGRIEVEPASNITPGESRQTSIRGASTRETLILRFKSQSVDDNITSY